ncbi:MAG: methyltransferase domain-containing protein [Actinomycetia bacterium]|nr:methyltransferase domain-containing protein [Actinomycetes bacterium]
MELVMCRSCGLLYNTRFDPGLVAYSPNYENSLHFSPAFNQFAEGVARRLVERYDIHNTEVVEVGSGSGDFLSMVCEFGDNTGVGFDPSHDPDRKPADDRITVHAKPYPTEHPVDAGLVCSRHVLEHLTSPLELLRGIRSSFPAGARTASYHEVPDATYMLEELAIWDLIYEHPLYYSEPTLNWLMTTAGFEVTDSGRSFGDQYLWVEAIPGETGRTCEPPDIGGLTRAASEFGDGLRRVVSHWNAKLEHMLDTGPVVIWGSGSKGVQFLNLVPAGSGISAAVDVNPRKHGQFVPKTSQPVISPEALVDLAPAHVLVMNPIYTPEIAASIVELGLGAEVHDITFQP